MCTVMSQAAQAQFVLQIKNYKGLYGKATGLFVKVISFKLTVG